MKFIFLPDWKFRFE